MSRCRRARRSAHTSVATTSVAILTAWVVPVRPFLERGAPTSRSWPSACAADVGMFTL
jgi:hypothetical protein